MLDVCFRAISKNLTLLKKCIGNFLGNCWKYLGHFLLELLVTLIKGQYVGKVYDKEMIL